MLSLKLLIESQLFLLLLASCSYGNSIPDPCDIQRKCTTTGPTVYAVADNLCHLFRNDCIYENEKCLRREKYDPAPRLVTRDECLQYCPNSCTDEYEPLCAQYNDNAKTFDNKCEFLRTSCQTDQSFIFISDGACIPSA